MRGECGIFVKDGKPIGGFFAWKIEMNPVRTGMDGNSPVYKVGHCRLTLKNWWISVPVGADDIRQDLGAFNAPLLAVFCRVLDGRLIPLQEVEMTPGEYAPGIRNAELIIEKACPRVGGEPV
jgi:hypothetical protein